MKRLLTAGKFCKKRKQKERAKILDELFRNDEAKRLLNEFYSYASDIRMTNEFIESFEVALEFNKSGLLLTPRESYARAQQTSQKWIDCDWIRNGIILEGIVEAMKTEITKANMSF